MSRSRTFHPSFLHSDRSASWAALVPPDAAKLAAVNWFKLTAEAHGSVWSSSNSVLIAFFILWEHKWSSPWEHASGWMPSSPFVSCKPLSVVKGNWNDSLCFVRPFRVCFLLVFFGFTANEMMAYDIFTIGIQPNVIYAHFCSHKLQDDEQWGVCSNVSCIKAKVSHHTKCLAAHRGQMWPFLNKASWFFCSFCEMMAEMCFSFYYDYDCYSCAAVSEQGCCCHYCCLKQVTFCVRIWDVVIWEMFSSQLCASHLSSIFSSLSCRSVAISSSRASLCRSARGKLRLRTWLRMSK